ncbi:E3 ubiquitin-protein ligase TRIM56-like [Anneissia japonica]|uniref:E3 ubiquitin-protein ligase TRIM56-like n=1 Tax=Anneissia japonica TaxID=1529436 RepID=UPI001425A42D|nr:E3 ubiquitin-protein ligase TRIM56-like [Anneissia japonica]XP_033100442.1 E3 ubiquitin-protein ligase TRIM56-like [Anneissia japonica]
MANKPLEELKSDFLNCQICMEDCVDPKLLQCLHFFCAECLGKWKRNRCVECPTCREVTQLRNGKISSLKSMFFVTSMIDSIKCKLGGGGDSVASGRKKKYTDVRCEEHGERLNFYCKKCKKPVCRDCVTLDHPRPSHVCENLCEAAVKARKDIEQGMGKVVTIQEQLTLAEGELKAVEENVNSSTEIAQVELKKVNDEMMKAIQSKHDDIREKIQDLANNEKQAISEKRSEIAVSNETLSKLTAYLTNLQLNGEDYDLVRSHGEVLKRTKEVTSAVHIPNAPGEPCHKFKPNAVCIERVQGEFMTLGLVQKTKTPDVKLEVRGPSQMPQEQQKFLINTIREAYTLDVEEQPHATSETYRQIMAGNPGESLNFKRANYIGQKMDDRYGEFWTCVIGDFTCRYPFNENLAEIFTVNDSEKVLVYKKPTGSGLINLATFEPKVFMSSGDDIFDTRVCQLVKHIIKNCTSSHELCNLLRMKLMQSFYGKWNVIFGCNLVGDDFFLGSFSMSLSFKIADEKLFIFRMEEW